MKRKNTSQEIKSLQGQLVRALADYDNLKKRVEREQEELVRYANQRLVEKLLPIMELFEKVRAHLTDPGLELAVSELKNVIRELGVVEINPGLGEKFNEEVHEVVETLEKPGTEEGTIAEVLIKGHAWADGKLISPAKVRVYGQKTEKESELKKETLKGF